MKNKRIILTFVLCGAFFGAFSAFSAAPTAKTQPAKKKQPAQADFVLEYPKDTEPEISVCPLKYGKRYAYSLEFEGNSASAYRLAYPILRQCTFTDAPAGKRGGRAIPFRATLGISANLLPGATDTDMRQATDSPNDLTTAEIRELLRSGWGLTARGYWGGGCPWEKSKAYEETMYRRELYWGQYFLALTFFKGEDAPNVMMLPQEDSGYWAVMGEYGIRAATQKGIPPYHVIKDRYPMRQIARLSLDSGYWRTQGKLDSQWNSPLKLEENQWQLEFMKHLSPPGSGGNYESFTARIRSLYERHGQPGNNSVWVAPTGEIANYIMAAKAVRLNREPGRMEVHYPRFLPRGELTLKIRKLPKDAKLSVPPGATVYRHLDAVYVTTPELGAFRNKPRGPRLRLAKREENANGVPGLLTFEKPVKFAALRLKQWGPRRTAAAFNLTLITPEGERVEYPGKDILRRAPILSRWGEWLLFPMLPIEKPLLIRGLEYTQDPCFVGLEVYTIAD